MTLRFSEKEALYMTLYPFVGEYKDFHAAQAVDCAAESLVLRLTQNWYRQWRYGALVRVQYAWLGAEVLYWGGMAACWATSCPSSRTLNHAKLKEN